MCACVSGPETPRRKSAIKTSLEDMFFVIELHVSYTHTHTRRVKMCTKLNQEKSRVVEVNVKKIRTQSGRKCLFVQVNSNLF